MNKIKLRPVLNSIVKKAKLYPVHLVHPVFIFSVGDKK